MKERRSFWPTSIWEYVGIVAALALAFFILAPVYIHGPSNTVLGACICNQRQIAAAVLIYCQDDGEVLPVWATMYSDINRPNKEMFYDSSAPDLTNGYVYNSRIAGKSLSDPTLCLATDGTHKLNPTTDFLTADGQHNTADGRPANVAFTQSDLDWKRHKEGLIASFLDGHVQSLTPDGKTYPWREWLLETEATAGSSSPKIGN